MTDIPIPEECKQFIEAFDRLQDLRSALKWRMRGRDKLRDALKAVEDELTAIVGEYRKQAEKEAGL